jgi:hypothetical protein
MKLLPFLLLSLLPALAADPSMIAHPNSIEGTGQTYSERLRILTDLDGDGVEDLLLSGDSASSGKMGRVWSVYLKRKGEYAQVGEIWAHPKAIAIEQDQDRIRSDPKARRHARIWVYLRGSGRNGSFGYYRVGDQGVDELKSVEIYPGDGGTELGNAIYEATFKRSPVPFKIQHSTTSATGEVSWADTKTN